MPAWGWILLLVGLVWAGWTRLTMPAGRRTTADLVVYSGRSEALIADLIADFEAEQGWTVQVRYGQTAELAATILEEGDNTPADVFFAQDAGALGALARAGRLHVLPAELTASVPAAFRSARDQWVGVSGRARVLVYHPDRVAPHELPAQWDDLLDPSWEGRLGWAPANGSFQAFVTAMRVTRGQDATRTWLQGMRDLETRAYARNTPIVWAVIAGEIDAGLVNHYYLHALARQQDEPLPIRNHYLDEVLVNVAGVGLLDTHVRTEAAHAFIRFLLSDRAQRFFTEETFEYPLTGRVTPHPSLPPLHALQTPDLDLDDLDDLAPTLTLLQESNVL